MDLQSTWQKKIKNYKLAGDLLHGILPSVHYHLMPVKYGLKTEEMWVCSDLISSLHNDLLPSSVASLGGLG